MLEETQKHWIRRPGTERWDMQELSSQQSLLVFNWAQEQNLFASWIPTYSFYDKAILLGGATPRMQARLDHLIFLWNKGICFNEVVWQRTTIPEELKKIPTTFIVTSIKGDKRPNTKDTLISWLESKPYTLLFISNQQETRLNVCLSV